MQWKKAVDRMAQWGPLVFAFGLCVHSPAQAVDGVVEINQAKIVAAGGFPYSISQPGSYRLTGNIDVSGLSTPQNVTAITISASHVTLDLNGFMIRGPVACSGATGSLLVCSTTGSGQGISVTNSAVTNTIIRNGIVKGMGGGGIALSAGTNHVLDYVTASENGGDGIVIADGRINHVVVVNNNGNGITAANAVIADAYVHANHGYGINVTNSGLVTGTVTTNNRFYGLFLMPSVAFSNNAMNLNSSGSGGSPAAQVSSGTSIGGNACGGSLC